MALNEAFNTIATNTGVSFEIYVCIAILLPALVFYAKDFKLGCVITFILSALTFMLFYGLTIGGVAALNWSIPLVIMFMSLIVMSFSLYAVGKVEAQGGLI